MAWTNRSPVFITKKRKRENMLQKKSRNLKKISFMSKENKNYRRGVHMSDKY